MSESLLKTAFDNGVAIVSLNRPSSMNALSAALRSELITFFRKAQSNPEVRVVILTGEGEAFCAGLDASELKDAGAEVARSGVVGQNLLDVISEFDKPLIAAVNGYAMTAGLELALYCDVIMASSKAVFGINYARLGLVPAWGITQRLPRIIGPFRAKEMCLSGRKISADLAFQWGLVNRIFEPDQLLPEAKTLANEMAECDAGAQQAINTLIDVGWAAAIEDGLAMEQIASVQAFDQYLKVQK